MDVSVAIGRNLGTSPMPLGRWTAFRNEVRRACELRGFKVIVSETGKSLYGRTSEDGFRLIAAHRSDGFSVDYARLKARLDVLRVKYGQESIALSILATELVGVA